MSISDSTIINNIIHNIHKFAKEAEKIRQENDKLKKNIVSLSLESKTSCPFCGINYITENTPVNYKMALKEHLESCQESPLKILLDAIDESAFVFESDEQKNYILSVYNSIIINRYNKE